MNLNMQQTPSFWYKLLSKLFDPATGVVDVGERRQAQLLAGLSLVLAVSLFLSVLATPVEVRQTIWVQVGSTLIFLLTYALSRTRFFNIGSWLMTISLTISPFLLIIAGSENVENILFSFIPLAFVIAAVLLSPWGFGFIVVAASIVVFALPVMIPKISAANTVGVGGVLMTLGLLLVVANAVQRSIEQARLLELRSTNRELQSLRESLEIRVGARTKDFEQAQKHTQALLVELDEALRIARMANYELVLPSQTLVFSDRFFSLLGTTAEAEGGHRLPITQAMKRFVHPEDGARLLEDIRIVGTARVAGDLEYRLLHRNGEIRHFVFRFGVETDSSGQAVSAKGAVQDITERKQAEEALRQTEDIYRRAIDSADAVAYSRRYGDEAFTFMGEKIYEMTGYTAEEMTPAIFDTILEETIVYSVTVPHGEAVQQARAGQTTNNWKADYRLQTRDGPSRWVSDNSIELMGANGKSIGSVGIMLDITERKETEAALAQQAAELATVTELATSIAAISDPNTMLQTVVDLTKANFNLYHAHIYLLNEIGDTLELKAGAGEAGRSMSAQKHTIPFNQEQSLVARAARTRQSVVVNDVTQNLDFLPNPLLPNTLAELAVPVIVGHTILGVLDIQSEQADYFTNEEIRIQTILAAQIGIALQNARANEQTTKTLQALDALTRRLTREGWDTFLEESSSAYIGFTLTDDGLMKIDKAEQLGTDAHKTILQPVIIQGERIGQIVTTEADGDEEEIKDILASVSQGLSAHLENLRLSTQTERALAQAQSRTEELTLINQVVSAVSASFDIQESMQIIVDALVKNTSADQARIALQNSEGTHLIIMAESFNPSLSSSALGLNIPIAGNTLTEQVFETRQAQVIDDPQSNPILAPIHTLMQAQGIEQLIVIPMVVGNEVIGTLGIDLLTKARRFGEDELRLTETLVFQAASAIQNARLFEQVQSRARQEQILREVTARVYAAPDAESVLRTAAQEISRVLGMETAVYLDELPSQPNNGKTNSLPHNI